MVYKERGEEEEARRGEVRSFQDMRVEAEQAFRKFLEELRNNPKTAQQFSWVSVKLMLDIARDKFSVAALEGRAIEPKEIIEQTKKMILEGNRFEILREFGHYKARPERLRRQV